MGENEGGPEAVADREEESDAAEAVTMTHGENEGAPDKKGGSTQGTRRKGVAAFRPRGQCLSRSPPQWKTRLTPRQGWPRHRRPIFRPIARPCPR